MRSIIAIVLVITLVAAGCGGDDVDDPVATSPTSTMGAPSSTAVGDPSETIHGVWITTGEKKYVTFNQDGSWMAQQVLDQQVFKDAGTFTFNGETLTVRTHPEFSCATYAEGSEQGSYLVDFNDPNTVNLTVIEDSCGPRTRDFTSGWTRYVKPDTTEATSESGSTDSASCLRSIEAGHHRFECDAITFDVSVGPQCLTEACGMIVDLHGFSENAAAADANTNMRQLGTAAGYVVVQPNARRAAWDPEVDDDVMWAFLELIIADWRLDPNRIHVGGFSMGAETTWRSICEHADLIASAAPAASDPSGDGCGFALGQLPVDEVDILYMHGTSDSAVSIERAHAQRDSVISAWAMEDGQTVSSGADFTWTRWTSPAGTVLEFVQHDWSGGALGGHCYPGSSSTVGCGGETALHYGEAALQFYIDHPKNE